MHCLPHDFLETLSPSNGSALAPALGLVRQPIRKHYRGIPNYRLHSVLLSKDTVTYVYSLVCACVFFPLVRLLLLRGRLAQACIELPEGLFDACQEGDEELMRFALCYNLLQVRVITLHCSHIE
jgi:hypothetical protein